MTYYFDVLPLHPPPEYLEALTSYLMRLAELNGISSMDGLSALCFPHQDRRITRDIADYPPVSCRKIWTLDASPAHESLFIWLCWSVFTLLSSVLC
jgi:hypothetical protein